MCKKWLLLWIFGRGCRLAWVILVPVDPHDWNWLDSCFWIVKLSLFLSVYQFWVDFEPIFIFVFFPLYFTWWAKKIRTKVSWHFTDLTKKAKWPQIAPKHESNRFQSWGSTGTKMTHATADALVKIVQTHELGKLCEKLCDASWNLGGRDISRRRHVPDVPTRSLRLLPNPLICTWSLFSLFTPTSLTWIFADTLPSSIPTQCIAMLQPPSHFPPC